MMARFIVIASMYVCLLASGGAAQNCMSVAAASYGNWKPAKSAPHDGTVVEMMETYGVAPWYGLFKWTTERWIKWHTTSNPEGSFRHFVSPKPSWVNVDRTDQGVSEDACLFWRPYSGTDKYIDPTGGLQNSVAYWCVAMHRPYNAKKDRCE